MKLIFILLILLIGIVAFTFLCSKSKFIVKSDLTSELKEQTLIAKGTIPAWLSGLLVRNGPVNVEVNGKSPHWIDGPAMLHAFAFNNGKVTYANRFLKAEGYTQVFEKGSLDYVGFTTTPPTHPILAKMKSWFGSKQSPLNANVNVTRLADQYVALTEVPLPVRFDPQTLETLGTLSYDDNLPQGQCFESAHPHYDEHRKELINYLISFSKTSEYIIYRIAHGSLKREVIARIPVKEPAYMHSFAVTENYVVLVEVPLLLNTMELVLTGKAFIKNFHWKPECNTQFIVVNRKTGEVVKKASTKPFFTFHHVNAFEKDDNLVYDIVCYKDAKVIDALENYTRTSLQSAIPEITFERFTLSLTTGIISSEIITKKQIEFPRINNAFDGRPYQYVYVVDARDGASPTDMRPLFKINPSTGTTIQWESAGCYPGEPVFVASPDGKNEDDGVILAVVADHKNNDSFLLILNAQTLKEIARATVPQLIPAGTHGQYFKKEASCARLNPHQSPF